MQVRELMGLRDGVRRQRRDVARLGDAVIGEVARGCAASGAGVAGPAALGLGGRVFGPRVRGGGVPVLGGGVGVVDAGVLVVVLCPFLGFASGHGEAEDLEAVGAVCAGCADAEVVAGGDAHGARLEGEGAVDLDAEVVPVLDHLYGAGAPKVAVRVWRVPEGEAVDAEVLAVVFGAVIEEGADHAAGVAVLVDDDGEALELADGVDAVCADVVEAVLDEPEVDAAGGALGTCGAELEAGFPFGGFEGALRPEGGALVAGRRGSEDDFVGVDLCGVAGEGEFGDCAEVGGHSGEGEG